MIALLEVRNGILYEDGKPFRVRYHLGDPYADDWSIQTCFKALAEKLGHLPPDGNYACDGEEMTATELKIVHGPLPR